MICLQEKQIELNSMLVTIKTYIQETPDVPFDVFYQRYICDIQDQNVLAEIKGINIEEILSIDKLLIKLGK